MVGLKKQATSIDYMIQGGYLKKRGQRFNFRSMLRVQIRNRSSKTLFKESGFKKSLILKGSDRQCLMVELNL